MSFQASYRVLMNFLMGIMFLCWCPHANSAVWQMPPEAFGDINNFSLSAADNNGHVMLLEQPEASNDLNAYYYTGGNWVLSQVLTTDATNRFDVAMDPTGTALAIYQDVNTGDLLSRYFDGAVWSAPSLSIDNVPIYFMSVAMNGPDTGVAVWSDSSNGDVKSSFYSGGTWSSPQIIATLIFFTSVDVFYSTNGTAVATCGDVVVNYNGVAWQAPQLTPFFYRTCGIDNLGIALLFWDDGAGNVNVTRFNAVTSTLSLPQTISTGTGNFFPDGRVAPGGTAVVVWLNGANNLVFSTYNGFVWSAPQVLFPIAPSSYVLALDTAGNALLLYVTSDNEIFAARLPLGGTAWGPPELVSLAVTDVLSDSVAALSLNGIGFAVWAPLFGETVSSLFANASILDVILPTPPLAISGFSCSVKFATQRDIINEISWVPSTDPTVVAYYIRRDGILIATVPSTGPFIYIDHNRTDRTSVYSVTAVNVFTVESLPVVIILP